MIAFFSVDHGLFLKNYWIGFLFVRLSDRWEPLKLDITLLQHFPKRSFVIMEADLEPVLLELYKKKNTHDYGIGFRYRTENKEKLLLQT